MPLEPSLNFNFSPADQAAINASLDAILTLLSGPTIPYVNLTNEERKTPSIGPERMPYAEEAVRNILPVFPGLASLSIPLPRTTTLLDLVEFYSSIKPKLDEILDRFTDLGINAENIVYKSLLDSYNTSQQQEGRIPGADVLIAAIAPLFKDQGNFNPEPPPA